MRFQFLKYTKFTAQTQYLHFKFSLQKCVQFGKNTTEIMIEDSCQNSKRIHGIRSPQNHYTMI